MKKLPNNVSAYKRTPQFDENKVPAGLLKNHNTKEGVWAVIHVESGELEYVIEDKEKHVLTSDKKGVIEPEVLHHIKPLGQVSFFIEFYR